MNIHVKSVVSPPWVKGDTPIKRLVTKKKKKKIHFGSRIFKKKKLKL